jgi:hypothetical protein
MADFVLTRQDFDSLRRLALGRIAAKTPRNWSLLALHVLSWAAVGFALHKVFKAYECCSEVQGLLERGAIAAAVAVVLLAASFYVQRVDMSRKLLSDDGWFLSPQSVALDGDTLVHTCATGTMRVSWKAVLFRVEDERNFYLFIEPSSAFIFPKTAIAAIGAEQMVRAIKE